MQFLDRPDVSELLNRARAIAGVARERVLEKLANIDLPPGANAQMGPASTAFDEILRYELVSDGTHSPMLQRELNDWLIVPRLLKVSGVSDVSNFGGLSRQAGSSPAPPSRRSSSGCR